MSNLLKDLMHIINEDENQSTFGKPNEQEEENPVDAVPVVKPAPKEGDDKPMLDESEYSDSAEFTEDFYSLSAKLKEIAGIVKTQKFKHWMEQTDLNFEVQVTPLAAKVEADIDTLAKSLAALEAEMERAE